MKIIVTIPHFYEPKPDGRYGSERTASSIRAKALQRCVTSLHQTFGTRQALFSQPATGAPRPANDRLSATLDVVLCTTATQHLAGCLSSRWIHHYKTQSEPRHLGFVCHSILQSVIGQYDYYCFLEDDLEISDSLFFKKLAWFSSEFGNTALLQPNRFEISDESAFQKLYVDGDTLDLATQAKYQDVGLRSKLAGSCLGESWLFQRVRNPHSGAFFLNPEQMKLMSAQADFGVANSDFLGPLESSATLPVMRHFEVYKPSRENASFLELRHLDQRYLEGLFHYREEADGTIVTTIDPRLF